MEREQILQNVAEGEVRARELERNSQRIAKEKASIKKQLADKEKELEKHRQQEGREQLRRSGAYSSAQQDNGIDAGTTEGQLKLELERKINENNNLNTLLAIRERKIQEVERKTKEQEEEL